MDDLLFDLMLAHMLADDDLPYIVQVGANSGDTSHDIREQLLKSGATALLIEPQPDAFLRLSANYADLPAVKLANVAIAHSAGTRELYKISEFANQFHVAGRVFGNSIASFNSEHPWRYFLKNATPEGQVQTRDKILNTVSVRCQTFAELVAEYGLNRVDVLVIDTEGFDFEVLKMADHAGLSPQLIKYEHKHLPDGLSGAHESWQFLADRGYRIVVAKATGDTIAWRD